MAGVRWRSLRDRVSGPVASSVILASSLSLNVYLGLAVVDFAPSRRPPDSRGPAIGSVFPTITGTDGGGLPVRVSFEAQTRPTLLYVLSPKCSWCRRNEANIAAIVSAAEARYRVVVVSLTAEDLEAYMNRVRLKWGQAKVQVVTNVPKQLRSEAGLSSTPETIVVGHDSRVIARWVGALAGPRSAEVARFFGLSALPSQREER